MIIIDNFKNSIPLLTLQIISVILYGLFTDYGNEAVGNTAGGQNSNTIDKYYPFFQDVHVMIFIGFGFLMTFLKKYSHSALGYTMYLSALSIQYAILINGFFHCLFKNSWQEITLDIKTLITGDFAAGAVLITFGALLGKTSLLQMSIITICELIFYAINESIGVIKYEAVDMGGSMYVHTFGAYFGLAVSYILTNREKAKSEKNSANHVSDTFAMIGTIFLWMYWPSFNGALADGNSQHRVVINTVLSLTNSCIVAFIFSKMLRPHHKFDMVDIQNATLAGGVAVGSSADLVIAPWGALLIGMISGIISVIGYVFLQPKLEEFGIFDTCGVHNLHGMPGIIGGFGGFISASLASESLYGDNIGSIFPARGNGRSAMSQGLYQLAALFTTLGISIAGGLITGFIAKNFDEPEEFFDDDMNWGYEEVEQNPTIDNPAQPENNL
jgi:ammonium transporter Rh